MRIIHTSDWHLGRIFHGVYLTEDQAYILDQFVKLIKDSKPDAIIIAGDIFDRSIPPIEAVNLLDDTLAEIILDCKVPIIMIAGNHDSPDRIGFGGRLLKDKGLFIHGRYDKDYKPIVINDKYGEVHFYTVPYVEPAVVRETLHDDSIHCHDDAMNAIVRCIREKMKNNCRNVLISHAFAAAGEVSESERPLSIGGSGMVSAECFNGFNYVALGHLHKPQKVGIDNIRYSGSLMKYSFSEALHKKYIYVADMNDKGDIQLENIQLTPKRDMRCIEGCLENIIKRAEEDNNKEDYIMVTLKDEGAILDPIGKIRKVYPNVMHLEREQFVSERKACVPEGNIRTMGEVELFRAFFNEMVNREINKEEEKTFADVVERYYSSEREA